MTTKGRWRGLAALVRDAVEHGSRAIERVQLETAKRPFTILEAILVVREPTRLVHGVHDVTVSTVHGLVRGVNAIVGVVVDQALAFAEEVGEADARPVGPAKPTTEGEPARPPPEAGSSG